ncbi:EF-hand [Piedraia hortae CBS 480.64]|uniref:EF-hand n=1 Tax=Piedraia hortae CBS 480.64 TaxID=1314780 RepID=A0A6A7BUM9_9PEZI|nr:EF-hand [Piedraia hortae CBS 480.64]
MAYNRAYNPDALPAHAEPEQAAQMIGQSQARPGGYNDYGRQGSQTPGAMPGYGERDRAQRIGQTPTYGSPPPPANYGHGPRPSGYHNRPPVPADQRPPTAPSPRAGGERDALWPLFLQVDKDRTGQLSEDELRRALVNGDYTAFDQHTVKMMIRMFDTDRSGSINFDEFCGLWGFLAAWRKLFDRFDVDRSGTISLREFEQALVAFGYRLSPAFVQLLFSTYAKSRSRGRGDEYVRERVLSFDLFVQACISLKRMTDVFKKYDTDRDGYITLSFEEFLTEILKQK